MTAKRIISALTATALFMCALAFINNPSTISAEENKYIENTTYIPGNGGGYIHDPYEREFSEEQTLNDDFYIVQAEDLPSHYDLRDENAVTPVRNQGAEGMCYAFSALGACESNILKQGLETDPLSLDLSEAQLGYFLYTKQQDPVDNLYGDYINTPGKGSAGGNGMLAAAGLASGLGTEREEFCPYGDWSKGYSEYSRYAGQYRLRTCECMTRVADSASKIRLKKWIMESGGVSFAFYTNRTLYYDNGESTAYYAKDKSFYEDANHAALIVGWDDDYSKENFSESNRPSNNGAWLVKNSYGEDLFDDGYFWISYEDPSTGSFCRYIVEEASNYDDVYEYDGAGYITAYSFDAAANIFTAEYDSTITDVSFYMPGGNPSNTTAEILVYRLRTNTSDPTDGECIGSAKGTFQSSGYYTIALDEPAEVLKGEQFSLVLKMSAQNKNRTVYLPIEETTALTSTFILECGADFGESYVYTNGKWEDTCLGEGESGDFGNVPLKAFAVRTEEYSPLMLEAALNAAYDSNIENPLLEKAVSAGENILQESKSAESAKRAAKTILAVLEKLNGDVSYPEYIYTDYDTIIGDSDGDGDITISDATEALRVYANRTAMLVYRTTRRQEIAMNIVYDNEIDITDATTILSIYARMAAGLI